MAIKQFVQNIPLFIVTEQTAKMNVKNFILNLPQTHISNYKGFLYSSTFLDTSLASSN